ncbi:MAG: DM13 domain-containing protein [Kineosporiaceae bacterium]
MTTPDTSPPSVRRPARRRRLLLAIAAALAVVALGVGLALVQPWRAFTTRTVAEGLPVASPTVTPPATAPTPATPANTPPSQPPGPTTTTPAPEPEPATVELARGEFITHEHATTGTARLLRLADGSRVLRIEGLDTSDGPDLRVWLTDAPVIEGRDGWSVFDDGAWLDLGELKGNQGDANYPIPPEADIDDLTSVSVWCRRFTVSFGAAELAPA